MKKYITKQSSIKGAGKGLFTNTSFKKGELIGLAHVNGQPTKEVGSNHNHNEKNPTANNIKNGNKRYLIASKNLKPGEEITTNYRLQPELEQPEDFMRKGGSVLRLPNKKNSKGYSRSLSATNKLFTQNFLFEKPKSRKNKVFDPNSKYYAEGGSLLTKKVTCKKCGWKWDAEDGGNDITTCHKCGGQGLVHAQKGGNKDAMTGMMKARLAYANEFGNPAAERMINLPDNPYQFDNGDTGSHYMASMDNYAVPQIQDENGELVLGDYGPESNEAIRFDSDEDANYFAENYKDVSPGFIEADLDEDEIEEYRRGGYIVEEIDTFQNGGVYTVKGSKGNYKKVNGKWQVDWNKSGKYQPLSKGDVKARTAVLDKMAKPVDNGISKVSSNSSDNTRVNNIYQKPLDWSFDPKYKNNIQAFVKKSLEEKEKAIQKEKEDSKIKKGLANNEGIKETVGQYNRRKEKYDDLNLLGKMIENDPADNYKPQPVGRSPFEDSPMTGIGGAPKMILKAGKWLKPLLTGTKNATQPFRQATVSALKAPLPLGKTITNATGGKLNLGNSVAAYFGADALYNQGDSKSDVVKSQSNFINNPSWNTLGDVAFETGVNSLGLLGLGLGKQVFKPTYNASKNLIKKSSKLINNTYKINPFALKENPNVLAHRVQKPGQTEKYIIEQFNKPKVTDFIQSNQPGWGRAFSTDPSDMGYYTSSTIKRTRGYNEPSEILRIEIPKKKLNELSIKNYNAQREAQGLKRYNSNAPDREFILPIEDIIKSEKFTENNLDDLYDYAYAYKNKKPHWFKGYKEGGATNNYIELDLTPEEIKDLIAQGYVIEELN